jgi:hypothetical protein
VNLPHAVALYHHHPMKMVTFTRLAFAVAALAGLVSADLQIVSPGGPNLWWGESHEVGDAVRDWR